ncbi:response regulator [Porticoccus sp. W117]|uniref:response regulator n=1 Tax=Porticoccus sp. W117 TaxID=3054777 RepID=UPI0025968AB0|nr:response regulator [Porticoccus sp. W117]MDM3871654.1 response regulator [Porticoccus sp. W117]
MTRVVLVDDHDLVRLGIRRLLAEVEDIEIVAEGTSGEEAIDLVRDHKPDVVFMDIRMPGMGGIEATSRLTSLFPEVIVIGLSAASDELYPTKMLRAGARGYIAKNADASEVRSALDTVMAGDSYISPEVARQMAVGSLKGVEGGSPFAQLTERELQIAQMITSGYRANEVAAIIKISPKTINTHKYRIYDKIGVSNDVELTLAAVRHGLVDPSESL